MKLIILVTVIVAFLDWLFGHPLRANWLSLRLPLGLLGTMAIISAAFEAVERRLENIERKLDAITEGK